MLKSELLELITQNEGAKLDFKRDDVRAEKMAKVIVSFANMHGGRILLGVEDDGAISGITRKGLQSWLMDTVIGRYMHPQIVPDYEEIRLDDEKTVVIVNVPMGVAKPYAVRLNDREDIYVRVGDTCQLASREQQARLFQSGGLFSVEKMPVHGSSLNDLDPRRIEEYFVKIIGDEKVLDWSGKLLNRDLFSQISADIKPACTVTAYALFAKAPRQRLPQAGLRIMVFPGKQMDYNATLDAVLDIPFVGLGEHPDGKFIEQSLPNRALSYLQPHISEEKLDKTQRRRFWDYPKEAIRELLVNAFAHRDWTRQNDVHLTVYSDRMEIESPGSLPNGMTIEKIKEGQQTPRNTNLVRILRDYGFLDDRGMGIRLKVIPLTLENNGKAPDFEASEDYFKVTLWKKTLAKDES